MPQLELILEISCIDSDLMECLIIFEEETIDAINPSTDVDASDLVVVVIDSKVL